MTPNEYIEENYYSLKNEFYGITKGVRSDLFEDFFHDCLVIFLQHSKAQQVIDNNTAKFFLIRIGLNQWRSKTSSFHYQYRKYLTELAKDFDLTLEEYDATDDVLMEVVMHSLDSMYKLDEKSRYRAMMIVIYHSLGSNFSEVERQFDIPRTTVREIYNAGKEQLVEIINETLKQLENGEFKLTHDVARFNVDWGNNFGSDTEQTVSIASKLFTSRYFNVT